MGDFHAWQWPILPDSCQHPLNKNKTNLHFRKSKMVCVGAYIGGTGCVIISLLSGRYSMDSEQPT